MEDDKLKNLFTGFNPQLSDDNLFMSQLERSLQAVEFAKNHCAEVKRQNRLAIIISAIVGFICGVTFTLCYPYLLNMLEGIKAVSTDVAWMINQYGSLMVWTVCSIATCLLTFVGYDISLFALTARRQC